MMNSVRHCGKTAVWLAGLGLALQLSGCSFAQVRAPVQDRSAAEPPAAAKRAPEEESGVVITPYPGRSVQEQRTPEQAPPPAADQQSTASPSNSNAVVALLDNAGAQGRSGNLDSAAAALERALRIEPRNAEIWYRLADIRLRQGQYDQAANLAAKSINLAGNNTDLIERNKAIIRQARQHQAQ
ncbi:MAG: tetratricopeptide repeat protein [Pseudomonadota bacterium]